MILSFLKLKISKLSDIKQFKIIDHGIKSIDKQFSIKVTLNGHPGVIVSGGSSGDSSLSTVEFYNAKTGEWLKMPNLKRGRSGHAMTITNGKLMVEQTIFKSSNYLSD